MLRRDTLPPSTSTRHLRSIATARPPPPHRHRHPGAFRRLDTLKLKSTALPSIPSPRASTDLAAALLATVEADAVSALRAPTDSEIRWKFNLLSTRRVADALLVAVNADIVAWALRAPTRSEIGLEMKTKSVL
ncbi:hypothetical protein R3P38DRAFT_3187488 [Favolaschia claudopus]|uniref:Uncharacterized protein n=1 Tax=Favolaschia claudopus TaxID=2862362 RepID=A0AAW0BZZ1_9AGAR